MLPFTLVLGYGQTERLDSLRTLSTTSNLEYVNFALAVGSYYAQEGTLNIDSIYHYANVALKTPIGDLEDAEQRIDAQYLIGLAEIRQKNYSKALNIMENVAKRSKSMGYHQGERKGTTEMAYIHMKENKSLKSISYYEKAYGLAERYKEPEGVVLELMVDLCLEYIKIADFSKASKLLEKAILVIDNPSVSQKTKCLFYLNSALFNFELKDYEKSVGQFEIALKIAEESNNNRFQMAALLNLGNLYSGAYNTDHSKAIRYMEKAIQVIERDTSLVNQHMGTAMTYLGTSYYYMKDYKKTIAVLEKASALLAEEDFFNQGVTMAYLGYSYRKNNQPKLGNISFNKALKKFFASIEESKNDGNSKVDIGHAYSRIAEIDSAQGNFKKSLAHYKLHVAYEDSINEETNIKLVERLDFVRNTAEKDKKIDQLVNQNNIQRLKAKQQTFVELSLVAGFILVAVLLIVVYNRFRLKKKALQIIKEKNEENQLLMREIHHRVKNNLQIILSLLSAQKDGHLNNAALNTVLTESQNKIRSMALIHQNLYKGNNFTKVDVDSYLQELIKNIKESFAKNKQQVDFQLHIDATEIKMGLAVPLGLILNELITNCYKYAFNTTKQEYNRVEISFKALEDSQRFQLIFKDNGIGLPNDFCIEDSTSFGIQLVHGLVEQLNGKIEVLTDAGTNFEIYLEEPLAA